MVQVEFVGCSSAEKTPGGYGWKPCKSAFLEIYVDGERFRLDIGDLHEYGSNGRDIHIGGPMDMVYNRTAINACCIATPSSLVAPQENKEESQAKAQQAKCKT
jgi:hypothetical protein